MKLTILILTLIFSTGLMADHAIEIEDTPPAKKVETKAPKTPEQFLREEFGNERYDQLLEVIALTNQERAKYGRAPVKINYKLMYAAREQAFNMAHKGRFSHTIDNSTMTSRLDAEGYKRSTAGENIALGHSHREVVAGWMASPGHRANILDPNFTEIGIYRVNGEKGPYWAQVFGRPQ